MRKQQKKKARWLKSRSNKKKEENEDKRAEKRGKTAKVSYSIAVYKTSSTGGPSISKVYPTRRAQNENDHPKLPCTSRVMCAVCCEAYVDDVDDITGVKYLKTGSNVRMMNVECGWYNHYI